MKVAIGSCFRNNAGEYIARYFSRVAKLKAEIAEHNLPIELELVLVWGDSADETLVHLRRAADALELPSEIVERSHGGPVYGSTEAPERMRALSFVGNGVFESIRPDVDALVYVESDLIWRPRMILKLLEKVCPPVELEAFAVDVIAPLCFAGRAFYDIWAFRKSGVRFGPFVPYHGELILDGLTEVDSVGSCLVMSGKVARQVRIPLEGPGDLALVGFCREARAAGFRIYVDARERIDHPC